MNGEYVSREDILDIASQYCIDDDGSCSKADVDLREMLDEIEALPSADVQPVPQWISVKERLPEENQKCLVYRNINADLKITTGIWHSEWKAFDGLRHGTRLEDTIAWMPLLEPPKDGDINEND